MGQCQINLLDLALLELGVQMAMVSGAASQDHHTTGKTVQTMNDP